MEWHSRYLQQANWTRDLRTYLFAKAGWKDAGQILEVGCGTGAILSELTNNSSLHGLDLDRAALAQCKRNAPRASLVQGNALKLPYSDQAFDIIYCHYLLLWVDDPLQALLEMKRVGKPGADIIAFAEPDYTARLDEPRAFAPLGIWQAESLKRQGADPGLGARLADLFFRAGIQLNETGTLQDAKNDPSPDEWEMEWAVLESDLVGIVPSDEIQKLKLLDQQARVHGKRKLYVPTYFAWGHT